MTESSQGIVESNGIRLAYEQFGRVGDPAVVLVAGMSLQRIAWPEALCRAIADAGFRVIRFDNRDVGHSSWTSGPPPPTLGRRYLQAITGRTLSISVGPGQEADYDLREMSRDAVGLLDALGIARAHFVGFSMGGMIAQLTAADHPTRVRSLPSIMSGPNEPALPKPTLPVLANLLKPPPADDRLSLAQSSAEMWQRIGSPSYPTPLEDLRDQALRAMDRGLNKTSLARHMMAILATGGFAARLKHVEAPTLILHGAADPLVRVESGRMSAACIPRARLRVIPGMGHDFPKLLLPTLGESIHAHLLRAAQELKGAARPLRPASPAGLAHHGAPNAPRERAGVL